MLKILEDSIKFVRRNYILVFPMYILFALSFLIEGTSFYRIGEIGLSSFINKSPSEIMTWINIGSAVIPLLAGGFIAPLLQLAASPITYGLINKSLIVGKADLQRDWIPMLKQNFTKYLVFFVFNILLGLAIFAVYVLILLVMGLLILLLKGFGGILFVIVLLALIIASIVIYNLLSLWYCAMAIDGLPAVDAAKRSVQLVGPSFWTVLGFKLLVWIAGYIILGVLFFLNYITVIGQLILAVVPALQSFIMIYFFVSFYREKTGR